MSDIAMCQSLNCPKRKDCYRYRAIPHEFWQSYSNFSQGRRYCEFFMPIDGKRVRPMEIEE